MLYLIEFCFCYKFKKIVFILFSLIITIYTQSLHTLDLQKYVDMGEVDTFGAISDIFDLLPQIVFGNSSSSNQFCSTITLNFGDVELKVGRRPRGFCSYCCTMKHSKRYVKLYFTNKYIGENMVEIKKFNKIGALQAAGIKSNIPTVIYIHGFSQHALEPFAKKIRNAYLSRPEERNIIIVDWGELCTFPWYKQAAENAKVVGRILSDLILFYNDAGELPISQIHLIGFSLGGQIVGFIGKALLSHKHKVPRITGLDPARPLFIKQDPAQHLSKNDAEYVDVIHTDGGKFGISVSVGHADFYPNGGTFMQPGCTTSDLAENKMFHFLGTCSHFKAVDFYAESVRNPEAFQAYKCAPHLKSKRCREHKTAYMGFNASKSNALGDLFLTTNAQPPYGRSARHR